MGIKKEIRASWYLLNDRCSEVNRRRWRANKYRENLQKTLTKQIFRDDGFVMSGLNDYYLDNEQYFKTLIPFKKNNEKKR